MGSNSSEEETPFNCKVDIDASPDTPVCIKLVMNDSKLVVASSSKIAVWDVDSICDGQVRSSLKHRDKKTRLTLCPSVLVEFYTSNF